MLNRTDISDFIEFLRQRRYSEHTISTYRQFLRAYKGDFEVLFHRQLSSATIHKAWSILNSFYRFLIREDRVEKNPIANVILPKMPEYLPRPVDYEIIEGIISGIPVNSFTGVRDRALFELGYAIAARRSDLQRARVHDLNIQQKVLRVIGKGNRESVRPFGGCAKEALSNYLPQRVEIATCDALFVSTRGNRLSESSINFIVRKYTDITPHSLFRHSAATHMLNNGMPIEVLCEVLNHKDIRTTMRYAKVARTRLHSAYQQSHPRA